MSATRPAARSLLSRRCLASAPRTTTATTPATTTRLIQHPFRATAISTTTGSAAGSAPAPSCRRHFHMSAPLEARRKPRFSNVRAAEMGLVSEEAKQKFTREKFPDYSEKDFKALKKFYTPEQMEALEAAESVIDPKDFTVQGRLRDDHHQLGYVDDMSRIAPSIDFRPRPQRLPDMKAHFMSPDEFTEDFIKWMATFVPKDVNLDGLSEAELDDVLDKYTPTTFDILRYMTERSSVTDDGRGSNSALAPIMPKRTDEGVLLSTPTTRAEDEAGKKAIRDEDLINYEPLTHVTGLTVRDLINLRPHIVYWGQVANQTRLGKIRKSYIMTIVGNQNGVIGLGVAKGRDLGAVRLKSQLRAIKNMVPIRRHENRTIYGKVRSKVSGTIVELASRPPGFGLRVAPRIFEICRAAGIRDLAGHIPRSRCPMNTVNATIKALLNQPDPEAIAIGRGKKLVDVRKVYYGGSVF